MSMKGFALTALGGLVILVGINVLRVQMPAQEALRHTNGITVGSYYRFGVIPDTIVFDLWRVGDEASGAMILGRFFQFAEEMKDREFREVRLAHKGKTKFILDGDDFQEIGEQLSWQNPIYLIRTFPERLKTPEGRQAYDTWTGGMIGVVNVQMEDVNEMTHEWYLKDLIGI
ncbi:MAG: hypothetical protein P1U72_20730 [Paracoccaceae bacterium]|nr:hypothetical protein [Paracoccaceae bacterium]